MNLRANYNAVRGERERKREIARDREKERERRGQWERRGERDRINMKSKYYQIYPKKDIRVKEQISKTQVHESPGPHRVKQGPCPHMCPSHMNRKEFQSQGSCEKQQALPPTKQQKRTYTDKMFKKKCSSNSHWNRLQSRVCEKTERKQVDVEGR